jgi:hypothetical protein
MYNAMLLGDVTNDGEIDNRDLIMLSRYLDGLVSFCCAQLNAADFNQDGVVDEDDLDDITYWIVSH